MTGVVLAALVVRYRLARRVLYPLLVVSQTIPMIVLAPLLILWFGFGLTPRVVVVVLIVFFPVLVSTVDRASTTSTATSSTWCAAMGAGPRQVCAPCCCRPPSPRSSPACASPPPTRWAARWSASTSAATRGLGVFIQASKKSYRVDRIFVAVVIIAVLTAVLFLLVDAAGRWAAPWLTPDRDPAGAVAPRRGRPRRSADRRPDRPSPSTARDDPVST